ncbi:anthranilate synthase component I family protein [uncultured Helicobacter sp.]|uniref:anthranilate synthase component I family protein n=2 Tax=uncultured Helicobacter sp. TaxID=175537 RepID=UPI0025E1F3D9|nr:chorismate-binding protein [uncultured Helicobacter sp.]
MFDFKNANKAVIAHKEMLCDNLTPLAVLGALNAKMLLESAYNETGKDRYSIMILCEAFCVYKENGAYILVCNNQKMLLSEALAGYEVKIPDKSADNPFKQDGFLESLALVRTLAPNPQGITPHDLPLPLGGAGYIGYEFFAEIEEVSFHNPPLYEAPECAFIFGRDFLIFDHLFDRLHIVSVGYANECEKIEPMQRVEKIITTLRSLSPSPTSFDSSAFSGDYTIQNATTRSEYEAMVVAIKEAIYRGDLLQCVPSQYMNVASALPPLEAYRHLRHLNPSPYMFYYQFENFVVLGASPEIMIRLKTQEGRALFAIRPIAGTRPRGESVARDLELEKELLNDEKENAEHLMLLDLARNDAGKVSIGGGVEVMARNKIERYSHVMHIVSAVQGELDTERFSKRDALKAAFPAGTLSGAPKIQAIKTIESLESHSRGIYGGAIGYFTYDEDMDFAIAIRTAVYQNGIYYLRSGAGIVQDSIPSTEYMETQSKVRSQISMLTKDNK